MPQKFEICPTAQAQRESELSGQPMEDKFLSFRMEKPLQTAARAENNYVGHYHPPYEFSHDWLQEQRRRIYLHQKNIWDGAESIVAFAGGSLFANTLLSNMPRTTQLERLERDRAIAGGTLAILACATTEYITDKLFFDRDQKMEGTVIADWLVGTAIAVTPIPFAPKYALMLSAHEIGRGIDHFRQPKQSFD